MPNIRVPLGGFAVLLSLALVLVSCDDSSGGPATGPAPVGEAAPDAVVLSQGREVLRFYGAPVRVGNGLARTYLLVDRTNRDLPLELGVSLTDGVMEGLPAAEGPSVHPGAVHGHESMTVSLLELPHGNTTPYQFVQLNWNPSGHEPTAIYGLPHFDFHFYTISKEEREAIVPADPDFAAKAASLPSAEFRPPFYVDNATAVSLPAGLVTVPRMGLHWIDVRSPELQAALGNPAGFQPFTKTYFIGSWDGRFIFGEPMITRDYLLAVRDAAGDEIIPLPAAARAEPPGFYPRAYRIAYDPRAHQFLIGLTAFQSVE